VEYESAVHHFLDTILARIPDNPFLAAFLPFQARIAHLGVFYTKRQVIAPGKQLTFCLTKPQCLPGDIEFDRSILGRAD
jgi:hypothetical protein